MRWGMMRVVTTGWRRVVTTQLAQVTAADDWRRAPRHRLAQVLTMTIERRLTNISSLAAAGLQEMKPD